MRRNETLRSGFKPSSRAGEGKAVAAAVAREGSEMAATSGAFVCGETAGALVCILENSDGYVHQCVVIDCQNVVDELEVVRATGGEDLSP